MKFTVRDIDGRDVRHLRKIRSASSDQTWLCCQHKGNSVRFNVCNRYLVVLYYQPHKAFKKMNKDLKRDQIELLKSKYGIDVESKD
ncbi:hypothetical protein EMCRGX_G014688 [Ephydatia muelleri]